MRSTGSAPTGVAPRPRGTPRRPAPSSSRRWPLLVVAGLVLASCRGNVFDLGVGDCFDQPDTGVVTDVAVVSCAEAHANEVYAAFRLPEGDFPGEDLLAELATAGCLERFEDWAGTRYAQSRLVVQHLAPTADGWERADDREVVCYVQDQDGEPLVGSVEGAGR